MPWGLDYDVRGLRERLGISQHELAQRLKVTASTVARWEQGRMKPRPEMIQKLETLARRAERGTRGKSRAA